MNIIFIIIGMNVSIIFLFDKRILDNKKYFNIILAFNALLFLITSLLLLNNVASNTAIRSLFFPLISQLIYYYMSKWYFMKYDRNSDDTFWTMNRELYVDGWFNAVFWIISILLFMLVL
jgi:Ca2+/Na+ antiporter